MKKLIITVDGPAAAGKGTISYLIARKYGLNHLDSGAFYRAAAWLGRHHHLALDEAHEMDLVQLLKQVPIVLTPNTQLDGPKVLVQCGDVNVTKQIRSEEISNLAAVVGGMPQVRVVIKAMQRRAAEHSPKGVVAEGRDTGIVIFPEADLKFFLTAAPEVRAQRRHAELTERGVAITFERVYSDLQQRDLRDTEREYSALRVADDAEVIDTTTMTIAQVVDKMSRRIEALS